MRALQYSVVLKQEVLRKAKLPGFKSIFVLILNYGYECWVMTERVQSQMQASETRVLQKFETTFDKFRNTAIRESVNIESLLLWIERSPLRFWLELRWKDTLVV